ncbi:hypothetical protein QFC19_007775 [Naganishia cerealis]|uniref:Uncharacterized protein n=1 Tax=Naganishia cerealis TaxID=610337 RepID=A0ACC2V7M2_9TREE|nr:hypothetical protein QFC19_007775 [Naganishia cerealis]
MDEPIDSDHPQTGQDSDWPELNARLPVITQPDPVYQFTTTSLLPNHCEHLQERNTSKNVMNVDKCDNPSFPISQSLIKSGYSTANVSASATPVSNVAQLSPSKLSLPPPAWNAYPKRAETFSDSPMTWSPLRSSRPLNPASRSPLGTMPFYGNLNTPSPPRRAEHLLNRRTRFEREMDNLYAETENAKREISKSVKKASALEGVDDDDKYVGPWVLGRVVGKGASGKPPFGNIVASAVSDKLRTRQVESDSHDRDGLPENLLLDDDLTLKIADFGMASFQSEEEWLKTSCGSPHYASPEIISGAYYHGSVVDVWSSGVILYALLCGRLPFDDPHIPTVMKLASRAEYYIPPEMPQDAANLIERIFVVNQKMRIRVPQILSHPFLRRVWVPEQGLPARRPPMGPPPFDPFAPCPPPSHLQFDDTDWNLVLGVCAILRTDDVLGVLHRINSPSDLWARRFYHLLKMRRDRIVKETRRFDEQRDNIQEQARLASIAIPHASSVAHMAQRLDDKENMPPVRQDSGRNKLKEKESPNKNRQLKLCAEVTAGRPSRTPSSGDDVFRSAPIRGPGGANLAHKHGSDQASGSDRSWKEKISSALSFTGLRSRSSKRKGSQGRHSPAAQDPPDVPALPVFMRKMTGLASDSTALHSVQESPGSTRARLSQFFSHSPTLPYHNATEDDPPSGLISKRTASSPPLPLSRPPMRERVSTIADRMITQSIPRGEVDFAASQPYGLSSHLSLHEPEFPFVFDSPLKTTAGASGKVIRPRFSLRHEEAASHPAQSPSDRKAVSGPG